MKTRLYLILCTAVLLTWPGGAYTQPVVPEKILNPAGFDVLPQLSSIPAVIPGYIDQSWKERVIPNQEGFLVEFNQPAQWTGPDPVLQNNMLKSNLPATIVKNFNGQGNTSGVAPPDTDGDVSPDYYMQMVNLSFQIFDKNGTSLYGPALSSTIWNGFTGPWTGTNDGDPIVIYDQYSGRWLASQFALPYYPGGPFYQLIAVSQTGDPRGAWNRYAYEFTNMPDYPKISVWPDGYYMTVNQFAPNSLMFKGAAVCVLDRAAMISGSPTAQMVFFNLGTSYGSLLPADADGQLQPVAGSPCYLANLGTNSLHIWNVVTDWNTLSNSTITLINTLTPQSFSYSGITINQPGTSQTLDPLASRLMFRLQYRNFGTYEVMLTNHTVNANGSGQAGVRWYELRRPSGGSWSIYQQGTFAPADNNDRWMASVAMNGSGDIALGYSVSGTSTYPSIRVAGQSAAASGSGTLDVAETSIIAGSHSQTGVSRWGDYSMMSVDPSNDATFWYTSEYSNGGWSWVTRIASFNFPTQTEITPVAGFTGTPTTIMATQSVTFTDLSTNNPTSWYWEFGDGGTSTLENPVHTYNSTGTYSVTLTATNGAGSNSFTRPDYITVDPFVPGYCASSGSNTTKEWINSMSIGSFTKNSGSNNGYGNFISPAIPLYNNTLYGLLVSPGFSGKSRGEYWRVWIDFNNDYDFLDPGELVLSGNLLKGSVSASVPIPGDLTGDRRMRVSMKYNAIPGSCEQFVYGEVEDYTLSITNSPGPGYCSSQSTSNAIDWITKVDIAGQSNSSGASFYSDFTGTIFGLTPGTVSTIALTPNSTAQRNYWKIWIDFDGNMDFSGPGEEVFSASNKRGPVTGSITIPQSASGSTRMRISMKTGSAPTSCEIFTDGEVEDYTVNITGGQVSVMPMPKLDLEIYPNPATERLNVVLTGGAETVNIKVYNSIGQIVDNRTIHGNSATIDLTNYQRGIYFIGADDGSRNALKKFIRE